MKIQAKVNLLSDSSNRAKAIASITIDDAFVVTGIRIVESQNGLFTAMPSRKTASGEYKDICFPITAEARKEIQDEVLKAYYEKTGNNTSSDDLPF